MTFPLKPRLFDFRSVRDVELRLKDQVALCAIYGIWDIHNRAVGCVYVHRQLSLLQRGLYISPSCQARHRDDSVE